MGCLVARAHLYMGGVIAYLLPAMAQTRTIVAVDPATGARLTRRTARTYVAVVVTGDPEKGQAWPQSWAGRPDLAAKQLAKWGPGSTARLAPVVEDPWAEPALPGEARPGAAAPDARPVLPGEAEPPAPVAQDGPAPELPRLRADAAAGRPVSLAALARALADDLATPAPTPDSLRARAAVRGAEAERVAGTEPARAQAAADQAQTLTAWADSLSPSPVADAWAGQPWDPGTPEARARVALQGERVATLWPIAQAVRGAGFDLPPVWWADGPIMAGDWAESTALAVLSTDRLKAAAAALAALPPVTTAQARALAACRQALASGSRPL